MKKIALTMTAFTIIAGGLTGCGAADDANEGATPTRYAGYEQDMNRGNTNVNYNNRNYRGEGPITDMMTVDDRNRNRLNHQRPRLNGNTGVLNDQRGTVNNQRGTFNDQRQIGDGSGMEGDEANHGMVGDRRGDAGQWGAEDMNLSRTIANEVEDIEGVDDASVIVRDNDVLVGIDTTGDDGQTNNIARKVERKVQAQLGDRNREVHVTTDEEQFGNIQQIDNDLQAGRGLNEVGDTIDAMIDDLGNAARQPFRVS